MPIEVIGRFDLEKVLNEISKAGLDTDQIMLQGIEGQTDKTFGTGSITNYALEEKDFQFSLFDLPYTNSLLEKYSMVRTRIMTMSSKTCYSYHYDLSRRIHLPLVTNDDVFFVNNNKHIFITGKEVGPDNCPRPQHDAAPKPRG